MLELKSAGAVEGRQDNLAAAYEIADALALALPELFAQHLEFPVDGLALPAVACLADGCLFGVHLGADVLDDRARLRRPSEDVKGVVENRRKEAGWVSEADDGHLVR